MTPSHDLSRRHVLQAIGGVPVIAGFTGRAAVDGQTESTVLDGEIPSNRPAWILLGEWDRSLATVVGSFQGWRTGGSTGSAGSISVVASSNNEARWRASATRRDAAPGAQPFVGFARVEHEGEEYFALELDVSAHHNYDSGVRFVGTTRRATLRVVSGSDVTVVEEIDPAGRFDVIGDLYAHDGATFEDGIDVSGTSTFDDPVRLPAPEADGHAATKGYVDTVRDHWERYDVVAEGGDPSGEEDVSAIVEGLDDDRVTIVFPPGRYRWENEIDFDADRLALVGLGDVRLVPSSTFPANASNRLTERMIGFGGADGGERLLIRNLGFDFTDSGVGTRAIRARVAGGGLVEDVTIEGVADTDEGQKLLTPEATDPGATLELRRVRIPDGSTSTLADTSDESTNVYVGGAHEGTLRLTDCTSFYGPNNGVRVSGAETSEVVIDGGRYGNSDRCAIRHSSDGRVVLRNARLVVDDRRSNFDNLRGAWHTGPGAFVVRDCEFTIRDVPEAGHAIRNTTGGRMRVEECYFDHEADERVFEIDRREGTPEEDYRVSLDGVSIVERGDRPDSRVNVDREDTQLRRFQYRNPSGSIGSTNTVIYVRHDDCVIERPAIDAPDVRFAVRTSGGSGLEVRCGQFDVATRDLRLDQSDVTLEGDYSLWDEELPRLVRNGWGRNDGDPNATGSWEGDGYEGRMVLDTSTDTPYVNVRGEWIEL
ncbi:MAG: hypothetical protein QXG03_00015 [Halalkalicoccus sp.]